MDSQSQRELNTLHPKIRQAAFNAWAEAQAAMHSNVQIIVTQGIRSFEESDRLYALGRTIKGDNASPEHPMGDIVTNAPGGSSPHNYGLAWDFEMITNGKVDWVVGPIWLQVVAIVKKHGFAWGGDFKSIKDCPHFENWCGYKWRDLRAMHEAGKFIPGTEFVDI